MNQKLLTKVLATTLAVILTFANFVLLGVYASTSYATSDELETQKTVSKDQNIVFDAYFLSENQKKTHTSKVDMDAKTNLYLDVSVKNGYLKNAKITKSGENNTQTNFEIIDEAELSNSIESIDQNTIFLKQINTGTQIVLEVPIKSIKQDVFDLSDFNKINDITLSGTYVNNEGKQVEVKQSIKVRNEWTKEAKAVIEQQTKTYIPYSNGEKSGTIIQTLIKTGLENNNLPIKQTNITVKVPEINGIKPEEVIVTANGTYATNNLQQEKFTSDNWTYDENTGVITITVNNEPNQNKVAWNKQLKDEYIVTYKFNEKLENIKTEQSTKVTILPYNNETKETTENNILNIEENQIKGNFIQTNITGTDAISKGYLYTKADKEINYSEKQSIEFTYADILDSVVIENNIDNFITSEGAINQTTVGNKNYSYYKSTKISKENFEKILGTEGNITITGENGEQLAVINKNTNVDENGLYVYTYKEEINKIKITTTKPVSVGTLEISHEKSLKGKTDYTRNQVESFKTLQLKSTITGINSNTEITKVEGIKDISLVDPTTKIEASVSNSNLSTVVKNENIEFRVILKTNDITCDLFKNPVVEIVLPSYIQELNIKDINLLYDKELKIDSYKTYTNESGNIVIQAILKGEDTTYNQDEISKGANLVINTDITLKKLTPTIEDVMKVYVTNENATTYEDMQKSINKAYAESPLKAVAPTGIVTTNGISGYNTKNETVTSISGEEKIGKLETRTEAKNATVTMNVINNYENAIKNIAILGRIPFEGNKNTKTGEDLGSNLTTILNKAITVTGIDANKVTIYYSANSNATKDLNNAENGWTTTIENIANIKSYLIVLNDYEMPTGKVLELSYGITIPENLKHNLSTYAIYTVYFDNIKEGTTSENVTATKVGLTTSQGPELEVSISPNKQQVEEGKEAIYTVTVKNVGKTQVNNIKLSTTIKQGSKTLLNEDIQTIQTLEAGETKTITYKQIAKAMSKEDYKDMSLTTNVTADDLEKPIEAKDNTIKIVEGYLDISIQTTPKENTIARTEGEKVSYLIKIKNVNTTEKENLVVTDVLPEGLTFVEATENGSYDKNTRTITWNLGKFGAYAEKYLLLTATVDKINDNSTQKTITNKIKVTTKDKQLEEEISFEVKKPSLSITQTTQTKDKVTVGEKIIYHVVVKNEGAGQARNIKVTDKIPEGLKYVRAQYSMNGQTYTANLGNGEAVLNISGLNAGESVDITIETLAQSLEEGMEQREVINKVSVQGTGIEEKFSNEIKTIIVRKNSQDADDPTIDDVIEGRTKISGIAWLDSNKNGKREETEEKLSGIEVMLIDAQNGKIVTDVETKKNKIVKTNEKGAYTFANLQPGQYMVVFLYDSGNYGLTTYKKEGINDDVNSDVISMKVNLHEQIRIAGVSDKLQLSNTEITNIDMGLIVNPQFDLKLDKVITKITAVNSEGTKTYNYDDAKFAKLDLSEKTINGTNIIIEYKIKITNEGAVAGYAKKIIDYIPSDMNFSSELNKDWYTSKNGNVYNSSLANTVIQPGETKEVKLTLTKKMTNDNTGLINNNAEIYESYNDLGLNDNDSTPANKVQSEDDLSNADAMISIKTGEIYIYITITLISITILGIGIYFINKKVLRRI